MSYTADIIDLATMVYNKRPGLTSKWGDYVSFMITNKMCGIDGLQLLLETDAHRCRLAYQFEHLYFDTNDEDYDPIDDTNKFKIALAYADYSKVCGDEEHIDLICKLIDEFLKLELEFCVMDGLVYKKGTSIYGKLHSVFLKYQSADENCCVCNEATLTKTKCNHIVCLPCRNKMCYGKLYDATCPVCREDGLCITKEENPGPLFHLKCEVSSD